MIRRARSSLRLLVLTPLVLLAFRPAARAGEPVAGAEPNRRAAENADVLRKVSAARPGRLETPLTLPAFTVLAPADADVLLTEVLPPPAAGARDLAGGGSFLLGLAAGRNSLLGGADGPAFRYLPDPGPCAACLRRLAPFLDGVPADRLALTGDPGAALCRQRCLGRSAAVRSGALSEAIFPEPLPAPRGPGATCLVCGSSGPCPCLFAGFGPALCGPCRVFADGSRAGCLLAGYLPGDAAGPAALVRPFDLRAGGFGVGVFEPVALAARVPVTDVVFVPGGARVADPAVFSDKATGLMLGFNWYLTSWMRTQFNWAHVRFPHPVRLGPGSDGLQNFDTLGARLQILF